MRAFPSGVRVAMASGAWVASALASALVVALAAGTVGAQPAACGVQRWPVKVMLDDDRDSVDLAPRPTTIEALLNLEPPAVSRPDRARLPLERRTFRVRAILTGLRSDQADGDVHLILQDPVHPSLVMVAEIPDSVCAVGSRHASDYAEARRVADRVPVGSEIEVEGIAFWDSDHGQRGMAENGIELHPVLRVVPVLTIEPLTRLQSGVRSALNAPEDTAGVRVWLNTSSRVYHCPGAEMYGRTARGEYLPESAARARGARPAGGRPCR